MTEIILPIKLKSPNLNQHWRTKHKHNNIIKMLIRSEFNKLKEKPKLPCKITITRVAPRAFDMDNYIASLKSVIDAVADQLVPGLAPGRADGDHRLEFHYKQKKGIPKEYALIIEFVHHWPDPIAH